MYTGEDMCDNLLKVEEVGKYLQLSRPMVYKLIKSGKLASIRFGTAIRLTRNDVISFVNAQKVKNML